MPFIRSKIFQKIIRANIIYAMSNKFIENKNKIIAYFAGSLSKEDKYQKIIALGKDTKPLADFQKTDANLVTGCQSTTHLISYQKNGQIFFEADSDALISRGLAALITRVYSGLASETILKTPPDYLKELDIPASLTPSRANGLYNIHLKMKQEALKYLL